MVAFRDTLPQKEGYRRFRIRTAPGPDDYAMMREVLSRYLARVSDQRPDLILVDGGRGHLAVLCAALQALGIEGVGAAALAKGPDRSRAKRTQQEKVFLPGRKNPVAFPHNARALFLLQRIRDDAHRFAVSYHGLLKKNQDLASTLETLPGIGSTTAKKVLKHFGGIDRLREATRAELAAVPALSAGRAETLYAHFHGSEND
jgi:excinuclease ABC subunit C